MQSPGRRLPRRICKSGRDRLGLTLRRVLVEEAAAGAAADVEAARAMLLVTDPRSLGRETAEDMAVQRGSPGDVRLTCRVRINEFGDPNVKLY